VTHHRRKSGKKAGSFGSVIEDVSLPENYFDLLIERDKQQAIAFAEYACEQRRLVPLTGRPPHPALLYLYLRYAQPTADDVRVDGAATVEARRVKYVRALHMLWRRWKAYVKAVTAFHTLSLKSKAAIAGTPGRRLSRSEELQAVQRAREHWIVTLGAPPNFDLLLQDFFDCSIRAILASRDPLAAMRVFWEGAPHKGRNKETNAERNFNLALAVHHEHVNAGVSIEEASAVVGANASPQLSDDTVRKIYNRRRREVLMFYYPWRCEVRADLSWVALLVSQP
jgi:hypothetical protein